MKSIFMLNLGYKIKLFIALRLFVFSCCWCFDLLVVSGCWLSKSACRRIILMRLLTDILDEKDPSVMSWWHQNTSRGVEM